MKMKKGFIVIFLMIILLVGCSRQIVVNDSDNVVSKNNDVESDNSGEAISGEENGLSEKAYDETKVEENKYRLSDTYYISEYEEPTKRIMELCPMWWAGKSDYNEHTYIESDGVIFDIECHEKILQYKDYNGQLAEGISYDVTINDELIHMDGDTGYDMESSSFGSWSYSKMYEIDLDENDQYKELYLEAYSGIDGNATVLRLTKEGIKFIGDSYCGDMLCKIGNKWIKTRWHWDFVYDISLGYYMYEDGEFKYVEKFATGEDIYDENGMFPKDFQEMVFVNAEKFALGKDNYDLEDGVRFNVLTVVEAEEGYLRWTIRLLDDSNLCKAGTVLENCYRRLMG